ncbi:MAG: membrane dipeptidase [Polyangiaceae bacterium]|nr:membrane dipeptidase [Polyangiaceae bacterium]
MMDRRHHLWASAGLLAAMVTGFPSPSAADGELAVPVVDLHVDLSYQLNFKGRSVGRGTGQWLSTELVRAGVAGVVLPLYVPHEVAPGGPRLGDIERSYQQLFSALAVTEPFGLPGTVPGVRRVRTWLAFEGAAPFAGRADALAAWVARGLRILGLVHTHDNALATSSGAGPEFRAVATGLTVAGREVVERALALGVAADVSHASDAVVADVLAMARAVGRPVVATHSNARALAAHPRNLTDEQIRGIAATGGVVGVNFHGPFLAVGRRAALDDVVRHVRHVVRQGGIEHVALGSDFEGGILAPRGLEDVRGYPRFGAALLASGMSRNDVERVCATNALRVLGHT